MPDPPCYSNQLKMNSVSSGSQSMYHGTLPTPQLIHFNSNVTLIHMQSMQQLFLFSPSLVFLSESLLLISCIEFLNLVVTVSTDHSDVHFPEGAVILDLP